jgi:ubiquinone/menaquinone biosynthesis C-methylase UbiE
MLPKSNTYNEFASQYAEMIERQEEAAEYPPNMAQFLKVVGDVSGLTVLDAGCGEGYLSRILAQRGANVTAIDIATRLVEMGRAKDPEGKITYQIADLSQSLPAYRQHFDLITSFFVLNDVYDYRGFLATLGSVLKPAGRAVIFMNSPYSYVVRGHITDYFAASGQVFPYRGMAEAGVKVHFYHRTLEEYLDTCFAAGFQLQRLVDVITPEGTYKRQPNMLIPEGYHFPFFTILSLVKA